MWDQIQGMPGAFIPFFFNRASFACRVMKYVLRIVSVAIRGRVQENPFVFNWLSERVALTNPIPGVRVAPRGLF